MSQRTFEERFGMSRGELRRRVDQSTRDAIRRRAVQEREQLVRLGDEFRRLGWAGFRERGGTR